MSQTIRLRLTDGTEIDGTIDGPVSGPLRDLLASGHQLRLTEDGDVSGHAIDAVVGLRASGDDTEGQAFTLRLPNAEAARDLQKRLLATGALVGVIVVGAAVSQAIPTTSVQPQAAPLPAPLSANPAMRDRDAAGVAPGAAIQGLTVEVPPISANPAMRDRDAQGDAPGVVTSAGAVHAGTTRETLRTDGASAPVSTGAPIVPPASANPANRDRGGEAPATTDESDQPPLPGHRPTSNAR